MYVCIMKIYTITIDGQPEGKCYTTILTLAKAYRLSHRGILKRIKTGRYVGVVNNRYVVVVATDLVKCERVGNFK